MVETIFTSDIFVETILPFLLMFTVIFAILQKTEILGKGKKQIDAITALVIGLLFVAFGNATDIVVRMIPILGISLIVILVFMILFGFTFQQGDFKMHNGIKWVIGILSALVVFVSVLVLTGGLDRFIDFFYSEYIGLFINGFLILILIGVIAAVVFWKDKSGEDESDKG